MTYWLLFNDHAAPSVHVSPPDPDASYGPHVSSHALISSSYLVLYFRSEYAIVKQKENPLISVREKYDE
jgi:hypothetical protein